MSRFRKIVALAAELHLEGQSDLAIQLVRARDEGGDDTLKLLSEIEKIAKTLKGPARRGDMDSVLRGLSQIDVINMAIQQSSDED